MSIFEMEKKKIAEKSKMEGKSITLNVVKLLQQQWSVESIAKELNISQEEVLEIKAELNL